LLELALEPELAQEQLELVQEQEPVQEQQYHSS